MSVSLSGVSDARSEINNSNVETSICHNDDAPLFSGDELRQFAVDDAEAGRRIGKILSALFIYTLLAMSVAVWWTLKTVGH